MGILIIFTHQKWNVCYFHESLFQFGQLSTTMESCNLRWVARLHMSHSAVATLSKTEPLIVSAASPVLWWCGIWICTSFGFILMIFYMKSTDIWIDCWIKLQTISVQCKFATETEYTSEFVRTTNSMDFRIAIAFQRKRLYSWHAGSARCQWVGKHPLPAILTFSPKIIQNYQYILGDRI